MTYCGLKATAKEDEWNYNKLSASSTSSLLKNSPVDRVSDVHPSAPSRPDACRRSAHLLPVQVRSLASRAWWFYWHRQLGYSDQAVGGERQCELPAGAGQATVAGLVLAGDRLGRDNRASLPCSYPCERARIGVSRRAVCLVRPAGAATVCRFTHSRASDTLSEFYSDNMPNIKQWHDASRTST
jgi:hypothetical protein